jgi:hypothetical protein
MTSRAVAKQPNGVNRGVGLANRSFAVASSTPAPTWISYPSRANSACRRIEGIQSTKEIQE